MFYIHLDYVVADVTLICFLLFIRTSTAVAPVAGSPKLPSEITGKTVEEVDRSFPSSTFILLAMLYI